MCLMLSSEPFNYHFSSLKVVICFPQIIRCKWRCWLFKYALYFFTTHKYFCFKRLWLLQWRRNRLRWNLYILENVIHFFKVRLKFWGGYEYRLSVVRLFILYLDERLRWWFLLIFGAIVWCKEILLLLNFFVYLVAKAIAHREGVKTVRLLV